MPNRLRRIARFRRATTTARDALMALNAAAGLADKLRHWFGDWFS